MSDMLVHTFNLSTWEAEAEGHFKFEANLGYIVGYIIYRVRPCLKKQWRKGGKDCIFLHLKQRDTDTIPPHLFPQIESHHWDLAGL